jgi:transposase-like protein
MTNAAGSNSRLKRGIGTRIPFDVRDFDREIILLCVRWYLRYKLSPQDLVKIMAERGLSLAHAPKEVPVGHDVRALNAPLCARVRQTLDRGLQCRTA